MFNDRARARSMSSNRLLAALPAEVLQRWAPQLEWVHMPQGKVLREPSQRMGHVYFPTTAIVSSLYVTAAGRSAEVSSVGCDGLVGISLFMGGDTALTRAVVETGGGGFRLPRGILMDEFDRHGQTMRLMLRYTQALIVQMAQTAVCNRHHTLEQQLSRWLLHRLDRLGSNELQMTQSLIGNLLGVRRESVTAGIARLERAGLLRHSRGALTVLDRAGLEQRSCECYAVVRQESDRLLPACADAAPVGATVPRRTVPVSVKHRTDTLMQQEEIAIEVIDR